MTTSFNFKRHILPHLLATLFFLLLTVTYFSPIFFDNKELSQHDILQYRGGAQEIIDYREKTGEEALWTNSMFGGMPAYLISTNFSGDLFVHVHKLFTLGLPPVALNLFVTLICAYILFAAIGMSTWLSIIGAIALGFTSYNIIIIEAGHNTKSLTIAYVALVLGGLIYTFRRNIWIGAAFFSFGLAMHIRANHLQITYYLLLMILIFGAVELVYAIRNGQLAGFFKRVALLGLGAALAAGVSFGRLYTTAEYGKHSIRGKSELAQANSGDKISSGLDRDYAFNWSYGIGESITLLIPDFYGGSSMGSLDKDSETYQAFARMGVPQGQLEQLVSRLPLYWGDQPLTSGPTYVGAIICFLFVLGLFIVDNRTKWWLLLATVLSLMLAWGKNFEAFNFFMFDYFPGYNKFRAVAMALVIATWAMPLMAIYALCRFLFVGGIPNLDKKLFYSAGITGGICLVVWLFAGSASFESAADQQLIQAQWPIDAIRADREAMMRGDAFRSLALIVLSAALLFLYLKKKVSATVALAGIGALILIDLWAVDKRYLNKTDFEKRILASHFQPTPADQMILQDKDLSYRVINIQNPFNDARTSYFHKSVGGYHGAKLRRYQDLIEQHIAQNNMNVLNMLNTRYFITGQPEVPVQRNPGALGNAWFVQQLRPVNSPDAEIASLKNFNPATEAIVDVSKFPVQQQQYPAAGSTITLTEYKPNYLKYEANAAAAGFVVFSEIYYPDGWKAFIDGKPADHIRVNYLLRGMQVPAGKHTIEFKFEPKEYEIGNMVSLICSILMLGVLAAAVVYAVRRKPENEETV